ncbi:MAG: NAD-dependent DNA ligase LigA [Candidatus Shapirobacteria bacterium]|nr:NAD-dependent DNA ligase LigA [Candidatus Shapirobacteria bacterium]
MITLDSPEIKNISPEKIGEILIDAKKAYYTGGKPIMDDSTYDTLEEILRKKLPYHRVFTKIGHKNFDSGFDKKHHIMTMGSLNKVNTYNDLTHYFELKSAAAGNVNMRRISYVVQPKCDGISLEIIYKNGVLVEAITRGDGHIGDVVTQNVVKMKNAVMNISKGLDPSKVEGFTGSVRCEIVMTNKDFKKLNQIPDEKYSNSRNAASGISQRLDGQYSEYCSLYAVDVFYDFPFQGRIPEGQVSFNTETDKINFLKAHGFTTVDNFLCNDFSEIETIYQKFLTKTRNNYPYEIDGLVIKVDNQEIQHCLGVKNNRPKGQVAYKFPARTSQTRIVNVEWQVGPMGTITPVAQVDPIEISGAVISYASLANYDLIKEKNINIDDIVEIQRRGDVIPHIESTIVKVNPGHIIAPTNCPSCKTKLIKDNKFLKCPNLKNCPAQILGSLKLFCDTLKIKGISDKTVNKLYQAGHIRLPGDFYKLTVFEFENLVGLGKKSGTNIVQQIQAKKTLTLKQILDSAIIPNFSSQRITQIINAGFNTPDKILNIAISQLEALPGIQVTLAQKIFQGIQDRKDFIESILNNVTIQESKIINHKSEIFGKNFAITGTLSVPRKTLEDKIILLGGKISESVTSNTSYLITNDVKPNSSKFISALKFNTKIISETEFNQLAV